MLSKVLNIVVNSYYILNNEELIEFFKELFYSVNFFYMLIGKKLIEFEEKIFDCFFVLYSEYEMLNFIFIVCVIVLI